MNGFEALPGSIDSERFEVIVCERPAVGVLRITMNQPEKLNAADHRTHAELIRALRAMDGDPSVSAVVLTGAGRAFSAGGDLDMLQQNMVDWEAYSAQWKVARDLIGGIVHCSKPIVSAINGAAVGAGLSIALLADIPIAARSARLLDGPLRLGLAAGGHATLAWPLLNGMARARHLLLADEFIRGEDAESMGLVSMVVDDDALERVSLDVAVRLSALSPSAVQWTKLAINSWLRAAGPVFDASLGFELVTMRGPDFAEGLQSLLARRKPEFRKAN